MDETRQNPEHILKQIAKEEQSLNRSHYAERSCDS